MQTDPIADMLTRIRNAILARHETVNVPHSNIKEEIIQVIADEGFISGYRTIIAPASVKKNIEITLKYDPNNASIIRGLKRISRPGLRVYIKKQKIPRVLNGLGIAILSTSKGIKSGEVSRKENLGGEYLCCIW